MRAAIARAVEFTRKLQFLAGRDRHKGRPWVSPVLAVARVKATLPVLGSAVFSPIHRFRRAPSIRPAQPLPLWFLRAKPQYLGVIERLLCQNQRSHGGQRGGANIAIANIAEFQVFVTALAPFRPGPAFMRRF